MVIIQKVVFVELEEIKKYKYKSIVSVNSGGDETDAIAKCILFVKADLQVPGNLMFCSPKVSGEEN